MALFLCFCSCFCLLYIVRDYKRMGSFTSAPKIANEDVQDDDVDFEDIRTEADMKEKCKRELAALPDRIPRMFDHARAQTATNSNKIRILQWNILSQCKFEIHHQIRI